MRQPEMQSMRSSHTSAQSWPGAHQRWQHLHSHVYSRMKPSSNMLIDFCMPQQQAFAFSSGYRSIL